MAKFTDEQLANAKAIVAVGRQLGASQRDLTVALMTALQESGLRNLDYGDRDSIGLFQQRDAWGSTADRLDPYASARMFFLGGADGQRGLLDFQNRDLLSLTQAAQAVQVSAFPDAYAKHEAAARTLLGGAEPEAGAGTSIAAPAPAAPGVSLDPLAHVDLPLPAAAEPATVAQDTGMVAPGAQSTAAPGAEAAVAPGAESTASPMVAPPTGNPSLEISTLDPAAFALTFPDAAGTKAFSLAAGGDPSGRRADAVSAALSYVGTNYAWGGNDRDGIDCSGLVSAVYASMGIEVPRLSADQARAGTRVDDLSKLMPGDLVAVDNSERNNGADHIAIYAGSGYIVEAPRPGLKVRRRKLGANETGWYGVHFDQLG